MYDKIVIMKIEPYNFFFHPFHKSHSASVKSCSIITNIALSALTLGVYFLLFVSIQLKEVCCPHKVEKKSTTHGEGKPLPGKNKTEDVTPLKTLIVVEADNDLTPVFQSGTKKGVDQSPLVMPVVEKIDSDLTSKSRRVKLKQSDHLQKLKTLAQNGEWRNLATHTSHAHSGFDWWMFPVDRASRGHGDTYVVKRADIQSLKQDKEFMDSYREGVNLVARSWGWNLANGVDETCSERKWSGYQVRLGKMLSSLRLFDNWDLRENLVAFVFEYGTVTQFESWVAQELSVSRPS